MDPFSGPEHVTLRARVESFCESNCRAAQEAHRDRESAFPVELYRAMADAGILGHCLPSDCGGAGGGPIDLCIINEILARYSGTATNLLFINGICGALIGHAGRDDQKQRYV